MNCLERLDESGPDLTGSTYAAIVSYNARHSMVRASSTDGNRREGVIAKITLKLSLLSITRVNDLMETS